MTYRTALYRALEWRIVALGVDLAVVYLITGHLVLSASIAGASNTVRTLVHAVWIKHRGHD